MESLDRNRLIALAKLSASPAVSIFLPGSEPSGGRREEPTRLRNLLRDATAELARRGLAPDLAADLLAPLSARLAEKESVWAPTPRGWAFFVGGGFYKPLRLDFPVPAAVRVGERFAVRPLLPALARARPHYVLALSLKHVRLLANDLDGCHQLRLAGLPASFDEAMDYVEYYSDVTAHTGGSALLGRRSAIFHGHGDDDEERRETDLEQYFRRIAEALERGLPDPDAPVVLAAVGEYFPLFGRVGRKLNLAPEGIPGNPDYVTDGELAAQARVKAEGLRHREVEAQAARWLDLTGGGRALAELEEIVRAAEHGRVDTLLVAREAERWGSYEPDVDRLVVRERAEPGDEELLDRAAARTLAQGGEALELPQAAMPEHRVAVAILRYAPPA
jgi:hypothetical protein